MDTTTNYAQDIRELTAKIEEIIAKYGLCAFSVDTDIQRLSDMLEANVRVNTSSINWFKRR